MALIDLGLIDGNFFNAAHVDLIEAAINVGQPAGEVRLSVAAVAPAGWLFLSGQVVVNFQGLYPQAWAVIPATWKSGSNANLPNMEQRFPIGAHASFPLGNAGGSLTKTIATANLPVHAHDMTHTHVSHTHSGTTGIQDTHHTHGPPAGSNYFVTELLGGPHAINITSGTGRTVNEVGNTGDETASFSGGVGNHGHPFTTGGNTADGFTGNTGNIGSGTALDITPSWVAFNFMLRVY